MQANNTNAIAVTYSTAQQEGQVCNYAEAMDSTLVTVTLTVAQCEYIAQLMELVTSETMAKDSYWEENAAIGAAISEALAM